MIPEVQRGPAMTAALPPVKCLIVDDLDDNLLSLSALLRGPDVEVLTARSGREALELLLLHDVALALLDVQMPEMDGFELAELMRSSERTRHVPLIFVTAGAREQQRLFQGYDAGAVDFLFKPIEPWILQSKARVFFDLHRVRQQLARELRERTETLRLNEVFSAVLAHDLRDPLNAMLTSALLIESQAGSDVVRWAASRVLTSGRSMSRMITDVLDLARARLAGGIPVQRRPGDLRRVLERVLDEQRVAHPGRTIRYIGSDDLAGDWDDDRLAQAFANLVGNAVTHGDDEPVDVRAAASTAGDGVVVSVQNAGEIAPELLPQIFDPFRGGARRARGKGDCSNGGNAGTGANGGLGLGLYIVDQIVRAHGGTVTVASCGGRTTFTVTMPRTAPVSTAG